MSNTINVVCLDTDRREKLSQILSIEEQVAIHSNTSGVREAVRSLLALPDGEHPMPKALQQLNTSNWGVDLAGTLIQGVDLMHRINDLVKVQATTVESSETANASGSSTWAEKFWEEHCF